MFVESYCANSISSKLYWIIYSHVTTDLIFSNMCCNRIEYSRQIFGILFLIDFGFDVLGIIVQITRDTIRLLYSQLNFLPCRHIYYLMKVFRFYLDVSLIFWLILSKFLLEESLGSCLEFTIIPLMTLSKYARKWVRW